MVPFWLSIFSALLVLTVGSGDVQAQIWRPAPSWSDAAPAVGAVADHDAAVTADATALDAAVDASAPPPPSPPSPAAGTLANVPSPPAAATPGHAAVPVPPPPAADGRSGLLASLTRTISEPTLSAAVRAIAALFLFLLGWLLARAISRGLRSLLRRLLADPRLVETLGLGRLVAKPTVEGASPAAWRLDELLGQAIYYLLLLLVAIGVLEIAGVAESSGRLRHLLDMILHALPLVGRAILTLIVAFVIGRILQSAVTRALEGLLSDPQPSDEAPPEAVAAPLPAEAAAALSAPAEAPLPERLGRIVFWLAMSFGLVGALEVLNVGKVSGPLRQAIARITDFLPALGGAALLLLGGYLLGRVARAVVRNLLEAAGFNRLVARLKLDIPFRTVTPSHAIGHLTMLLILLQAGIAALAQLEVRSLANPLTAMLASFYSALPAVGLAILIVAIGVLLGRMVRRWVDTGLKNLGFDRLMERIGLGKLRGRGDGLSLPSELVAFAAQAAVLLIAAAQALEAVHLLKWAGYVEAILRFAAERLAVSLLLMLVGVGIGTYVREQILARRRPENEDSMTWIAAAGRWVVLVFAFTIAIYQLGIAEQFVSTAFVLLFGSLCLALALAFGLGARDIAGEIVRRQLERTHQAPRPRPPEDLPER